MLALYDFAGSMTISGGFWYWGTDDSCLLTSLPAYPNGCGTLGAGASVTTIIGRVPVHSRQYLIGPEPREVRPDWLTRELPDGLILSACPTLPVTETPHGLLLGDAVATVTPDGGPDTWGGRWVLITDGELRLDSGGLLSCFMRTTPTGQWTSSSLEILRTLEPELPGHDDRLTRNWRVMDWYPPPHAAIGGVSRLMVSQALALSTGAVRRVELPSPGVDVDPDAAIERVSSRLIQAVRGASELARQGGGRVWIGLTGGRDSRVVLAAAAAAGIEAMTYTFIRPETVQGDRDLPSKLAATVGYDNVHIPLEVVDPVRAAEFDEHTCGGYAGGPQLQYTTGGWAQVEDTAVALEGSGLELFRCFYFERLPRDFGTTPAGAAEAMLSKFPSPRPDAIHAWAEWAFPGGRSEGMDWRDRIYLEQRIGGWLSAGLQGFDISGRRMVHIANDRSVISDMLSFPVPQRTDSVHTAALVRHMAPDLAAFPYNPGTRPKGKRGGKDKRPSTATASPDSSTARAKGLLSRFRRG